MVERMPAASLLAAVTAIALILAACGGGDSQSASPPTGRIAFTSDREGIPQVYVMNADGSDQTNLTNHPQGGRGPWWSPDGVQIAFASQRNAQPDIYLMNADGSDVQQLTDDPALDGFLRWSPDGSKVAFYSFKEDVRGLLWLANADLTEQTPLLESIHPAGPDVECAGGFPGSWFPDGQSILFRGSQGATKALQICSVNVDGSDIRVIFSEPNTNSFFPVLSPDATKIAFVSDRDAATDNSGNIEIYVIDVDGGNLSRITNDDAADTTPTWSPDGQWIAFASDRDGDFEIYIVQSDGTGLRQLTDNTASDSDPAWSPPVAGF